MKFRRVLNCFAVLLSILIFLCSCSAPAVDADADKTTIVVGTYHAYEWDSLYRLADEFNHAQSDIQVEIETYSDATVSSKAQMDAAEAQMYASFIAGNTPDLYDTMGIDTAKLRKTGLISDWYPIMQSDATFDMTKYQTHIWNALEDQGKLYQLCASFTLTGLAWPVGKCDGRTGWTLDEFDEMMQLADCEVSGKRMLQLQLWYGTQMEWIDFENNTCDYTCESFFQWLNQLKSLPEQVSEELEFGLGTLNYISSYIAQYDRDGYGTRYTGLPCLSASGPRVSVETCFALASNTTKADACWQFMKWLLSYDVQAHDYQGKPEHYLLEGRLPVHREVWETLLQRASLSGDDPDSLVYLRGAPWKPSDESGRPPFVSGLPQEEIDYLRDLVANASGQTMFHEYSDVTTIVEEEIMMFLAGDISDEECARRLQSRFTILLAERK